MEVNYPKVKSSADQRVFVEFYQNKKRYRLFNGSKINVEIHPNSYPISIANKSIAPKGIKTVNPAVFNNENSLTLTL